MAIVNAFTTVNPETEATVRAVDYQVVGAGSRAVPRVFGRRARRRALEAGRGRGIVTAAAVEARYDFWEADDHVRAGLADA